MTNLSYVSDWFSSIPNPSSYQPHRFTFALVPNYPEINSKTDRNRNPWLFFFQLLHSWFIKGLPSHRNKAGERVMAFSLNHPRKAFRDATKENIRVQAYQSPDKSFLLLCRLLSKALSQRCNEKEDGHWFLGCACSGSGGVTNSTQFTVYVWIEVFALCETHFLMCLAECEIGALVPFVTGYTFLNLNTSQSVPS